MLRTIRSFVRREGRMSDAQELAFKQLWPEYGIDIVENIPLDFTAIFGRQAPCALEIGFGNGEALVAMAKLRPDVNFIGVEVYQTGTGVLFQTLAAEKITNVRVIHKDVMTLFASVLPKHSLADVYIYFPDPWPKRKHVKRRLLGPSFLAELKNVLMPGGGLHFATDWPEYGRHAHQVLMQDNDFIEINDKSVLPYYCPRPSTKFYRKALQLGHPITDLSFKFVN